MDENVIPITNNPRLIFIPYKTDSSSACIGHEFNNDIDASSVETGEELESIGQKIRDFFMSSYLYCLILGSISLMSGLLLSIIAFHGLNTNNSSAIMGKKKRKNTKKISYFCFILGPVLIMFGLGAGVTGTYLCLSRRKMLNDIKARKMRYKSFVSLHHTPTHSDLVDDHSAGDIRSITETYQKIIQDDEDEGKLTLDTLPQVTVKMASDDEDDHFDEKSSGECIILEIPKSRRSSFHGESLEIDLQKSIDSITESRRESRDFDIPVDT